MSLLSYDELLALAARGVIRGVNLDQVNATSIDVTLGSRLLVEERGSHEISLRDKEPLKMKRYELTEQNGFVLHPGQFVLAHTEQHFYLPNDISAEYKLRSSMARAGLNHALAGWCDAGWYGSVLTLELMNVTKTHSIKIHKGDKIGQMIFFKHRAVPDEYSYARRGTYNNDMFVQGVKKTSQLDMFEETK